MYLGRAEKGAGQFLIQQKSCDGSVMAKQRIFLVANLFWSLELRIMELTERFEVCICLEVVVFLGKACVP